MLAMTVSTVILPSLSVLAASVIEDLGITRAGYGLLITSIAGVTAAASTSAGFLADRLGGRRLLLLIAGVVLFTSMGVALSTGLIALVVFGMLSGLANAGGNPASNKLIVEYLPVGRRGATMGFKQSGVQFGYAFVGLTLPAAALLVGWRTAMLAVTIPAILLVILVLRFLPPDAPAPRRSREGRARAVPSDVHWLTAYSLLMGIGTSIVTTFLPLFSQEELGFSPARAGATVSVLGTTGVIARVLIARWAEHRVRFEPVLAALAVGSAGASSILLLARWSDPDLVWFATLLGGVSVVAWNAVANLAAVSMSDPLVAGRASGLINRGFMTGFTLGPVIFGSAVEWTGSYTPGLIGVGLCFLAAAALMSVRARRAGAPALIAPPSDAR